MKRYFLFYLTLQVLIGFSLHANVRLFKKSDIDPLISEITQEHGSQHPIAMEEFLRNAFVVYFEQFDPDKIYLLKTEVDPYVNATSRQLAPYLKQYQQSDYAVFEQMNKVIIQSILRARKMREKIFSFSSRYFNLAQKRFQENRDADAFSNLYASSEEELNQRQIAYLMNFLMMQMEKFGDADVMKNREHILAVYKDTLEDSENRFLGIDFQKKAFDKEHKENEESILILKALAKSLDSHSTFFDATEASSVRTRLEKEYEGVGLILEERADGIAVKAVIQGSPADLSGKIKVDDKVIAINDYDVTNESYAAVLEMLQGQKGDKVKLNLQRDGKVNYSVNLVYTLLVMQEDRVTVKTVPFRDGIIAMLTLDSFYQGELGVSAEGDLLEAINKLKKEGKLLGLILDLRENSGGFLAQAIKVAGLFITNGIVAMSKYGDGSLHLYRDTDSSVAFNGPLIILTSRLTASAAEIVAQALQDYGVALVVGDDRTYGKGTIQSQTVTSGDSDTFFKVTVGKYYTVSGRTPQQSGVLADIIVPGSHINEAIGERYLENVVAKDEIEDEFDDMLGDLDLYSKDWYLRYYLPTLQKKLTVWQTLAPALRAHSRQRILSNMDYKRALEGRGVYLEGKAGGDSSKNNKRSIGDLQAEEAFNIVKEMIELKGA